MPPRQILLVDDSRVVHELARVAIEVVAGWQMLSADSGAEAVPTAASARPDAILVDVVMPDMDGPATVLSLRENVQTRDIPIVFLTAEDDPGERRRLAAMDVAGVLRKPFEVAALAGDIAAMLDWPA